MEEQSHLKFNNIDNSVDAVKVSGFTTNILTDVGAINYSDPSIEYPGGKIAGPYSGSVPLIFDGRTWTMTYKDSSAATWKGKFLCYNNQYYKIKSASCSETGTTVNLYAANPLPEETWGHNYVNITIYDNIGFIPIWRKRCKYYILPYNTNTAYFNTTLVSREDPRPAFPLVENGADIYLGDTFSFAAKAATNYYVTRASLGYYKANGNWVTYKQLNLVDDYLHPVSHTDSCKLYTGLTNVDAFYVNLGIAPIPIDWNIGTEYYSVPMCYLAKINGTGSDYYTDRIRTTTATATQAAISGFTICANNISNLSANIPSTGTLKDGHLLLEYHIMLKCRYPKTSIFYNTKEFSGSVVIDHYINNVDIDPRCLTINFDKPAIVVGYVFDFNLRNPNTNAVSKTYRLCQMPISDDEGAYTIYFTPYTVIPLDQFYEQTFGAWANPRKIDPLPYIYK